MEFLKKNMSAIKTVLGWARPNSPRAPRNWIHEHRRPPIDSHSRCRPAFRAIPLLIFLAGGWPLIADDASIKQDELKWSLETTTMERVVALEDGKLLLKSFKNKNSGRELVPPATPSDEFFVSVNESRDRWSGSTGGWKLAGSKVTVRSQGERQLAICLERGALQVTKSYLVYHGSSIIREWVTFKSVGEIHMDAPHP